MAAPKSAKIISDYVGVLHVGNLRFVPGEPTEVSEKIMADFKGHFLLDAMVSDGTLRPANGGQSEFKSLQELFDAGATESKDDAAVSNVAADADEYSSERPTPKAGIFQKRK